MKNYPFEFNTLKKFADSDPYGNISTAYTELYSQLNQLKEEYNFPAIHADIGSFVSFLMPMIKPRKVFEMGSGYGHSAFWFLLGGQKTIEEMILTEKRNDLEAEFQKLPWPAEWKGKLKYNNQDAFEVLAKQNELDVILIDGVKADYLKFLEVSRPHLVFGGHVFIDNSFWRGSFLDKEQLASKKSAQNIKELHRFIRESKDWESVFIPFMDGLTILRKI